MTLQQAGTHAAAELENELLELKASGHKIVKEHPAALEVARLCHGCIFV
jgi:hypothetical protein